VDGFAGGEGDTKVTEEEWGRWMARQLARWTAWFDDWSGILIMMICMLIVIALACIFLL